MMGVKSITGERILPLEPWICPVELVSAENDFNVKSIWTHALKF